MYSKNKFKLSTLSILLGSLLCLSACNQNAVQNNQSASETSASSVSSVSEPQVASDISPEIKDIVLKYIQEEIKAGRLDPKEVTDENVLALVRILTEVQRRGDLGREELIQNMHNMNQIIEDHNESSSIASKVNSFVGNGSAELAAKIRENTKQNNHNLVINEVRQIFDTPFYAVYFNGSSEPMFTTSNNNFYISRMDNQLSVLQDKTGKPVQTIQSSADIFKEFVQSIETKNLIQHKLGNGEHKIYVFTDPDCPYCRAQDLMMFKNLTANDNVTVYYVMNPLDSIHPEAFDKASRLLCSDDPSKSWEEWQVNRKMPTVPKFNEETCSAKVYQQTIYPEMLGLNSTPITINEYGMIYQGAIDDVQKFREFLNFKPSDLEKRQQAAASAPKPQQQRQQSIQNSSQRK